MRHLGIVAALAIGLSFAAAGGTLAKAAVCKDAAGKIIKCPAKTPATATAPAKTATKTTATKTTAKPAKVASAAPTKPIQCRDAKGQITKCPPAAAKPAPKTAAMAPAAKAAPAAKTVKTARAPRGTSTKTASIIPTIKTPGAPAGATAKCKDGSFSMAKSHAGSCAGHQGVANWI